MSEQLNSIDVIFSAMDLVMTGGPLFKDSKVAGDSLANLHILVKLLAKSDFFILFIGERGTGKELIADYYIKKSDRDKKKFRTLNCAAFNDTTLLSELFGHEKGAFTGADVKKVGLFSDFNGEGVLLDELGAASEHFQASLLRVLETRDFRPVGGTGNTIELGDTRIIAATSQPGKIRRDLYDRFIPLYIPPLSERSGDIPKIIERLWHNIPPADDGYLPPQYISQNVLDGLRLHNWPGNIRELRNVLRIALLLNRFHDPNVLRTNDFPNIPNLSNSSQPGKSQKLKIQNLPKLSDHVVPSLPLEYFLTPPPEKESQQIEKDSQTDLSLVIENAFESISPKQYIEKFWEYYARRDIKAPYLTQKFKEHFSGATARKGLREAKKRITQSPSD